MPTVVTLSSDSFNVALASAAALSALKAKVVFVRLTIPLNAPPTVEPKSNAVLARFFTTFSVPFPVSTWSNSAMLSRFNVASAISTFTVLLTLLPVRVTSASSVTCSTPLPVTLLPKVPLKPLSDRVSPAPASATLDDAPRLFVDETVSLLLPAKAYWPRKLLLLAVSAVSAPPIISTVEPTTPLRTLAMLSLTPFKTR
ncbi:Uncharacterised protein [Yersinia similis]|nr:Uncharacterised protein [Yersinia similis]CNC71076.1 Uncharacterised protein [Yersinia similis]